MTAEKSALAKDVEEIVYPGEIEAQNDVRNRRKGLSPPADTVADLVRLAEETGSRARSADRNEPVCPFSRSAPTRRYSAHLGYMFTKHPLEERFAAAAAEGFSDVEHPGPYSIPVEQVADLCRANELHFVKMAFPAGDPGQARRASPAFQGEDEFRRGVEKGLSYALNIVCPFLHVMSGLTPQNVPGREVWSTYIANLGFTCEAAAAADLRVHRADRIGDDRRLSCRSSRHRIAGP